MTARSPVPFLPGKLYYGWYMVLAGAVNNFLILGVVFLGFGVLIEPMRNELGWSMAAITAGVSIRAFQQGMLAPIAGILIDRIGPRRVSFTGVLILVTGLFMFSQVHQFWFYLLASFVIALGQSLGGLMAFGQATMHWFSRKRGRAIGILNAGNAAGFLMVPIMALMVEAFGWRESLMISAVVILIIGAPLTLMLRLRPQPFGYGPDGVLLTPEEQVQSVAAQASGNPEGNGLTGSEAVRTRTFYFLILANTLGGALYTTFLSLQVPHLRNVGYSVGAASAIVGFYGVTQIFLRITTGAIGDRFGRKRMLFIAYELMAVGMLVFSQLDATRWWLLPPFYLLYATGQAAWVVGNQTIVADFFGTKRYATIQGILQGAMIVPGIAAPVLAGWVFDLTASYRMIFTIFAFSISAGGLFIHAARRPPWPEQDAASLSAT